MELTPTRTQVLDKKKAKKNISFYHHFAPGVFIYSSLGC
jgi:hypothetical protein